MKAKQCTICKLDLELTADNFRQSKYNDTFGNAKIYWCSYCKRCQDLKTKEWHQNNKEKCRNNEKKYRENHLQKVKKRKSDYKKRNKDQISQYNKDYRIQHRDVRRQQDRKRRQSDIAFRLRKLINRSVQKPYLKVDR